MDDPVRWEDPKPEFARCAAAIGHVHAEPDDNDSVTRSISLEKYVGRDRRWALAAEAFRLSRGGECRSNGRQATIAATWKSAAW
jgi:hypothetical protein